MKGCLGITGQKLPVPFRCRTIYIEKQCFVQKTNQTTLTLSRISSFCRIHSSSLLQLSPSPPPSHSLLPPPLSVPAFQTQCFVSTQHFVAYMSLFIHSSGSIRISTTIISSLPPLPSPLCSPIKHLPSPRFYPGTYRTLALVLFFSPPPIPLPLFLLSRAT